MRGTRPLLRHNTHSIYKGDDPQFLQRWAKSLYEQLGGPEAKLVKEEMLKAMKSGNLLQMAEKNSLYSHGSRIENIHSIMNSGMIHYTQATYGKGAYALPCNELWGRTYAIRNILSKKGGHGWVMFTPAYMGSGHDLSVQHQPTETKFTTDSSDTSGLPINVIAYFDGANISVVDHEKWQKYLSLFSERCDVVDGLLCEGIGTALSYAAKMGIATTSNPESKVIKTIGYLEHEKLINPTKAKRLVDAVIKEREEMILCTEMINDLAFSGRGFRR